MPPPVLGLTIAGVDRTNAVRPNSAFKLTGGVGTQQLVAKLLDTDSSIEVNAKDVVRATLDGVKVFEGLVEQRAYSRLGLTDARVIDLTVGDYNSLLAGDVINVAVRTVDETVGARIAWLVTTFGTKGVTVGAGVLALSTPVPGGEDGRPEQDFSGKTLAAAVEQVAKLVGVTLYIDSDKVLRSTDEPVAAPFALSDAPNNSTTFRTRNFTLSEDFIDLVHRVLVRGAEGVSVTRELAVLPANPADIISAVINDDALTSIAMATAAGDAILVNAGAPRRSGSVEVLVPGLRPGMTVQVTNARYGLVDEPFYVIGVDFGAEGALWRYRLTLDSEPPELSDVLGGAVRTAARAAGVAHATARRVADLSAAGANMVPNSSFENADSTGYGTGAGWVFGFEVADAYHGARVARGVRAAAVLGSLSTPRVAVDRLDDWWVSALSFMRVYTSGTAMVELREYDAGDALLATTTIAEISAAEDRWTRHALHMGPNDQLGRRAFHADTTGVRLAFRSDGAATFTWDVDGVQVERGRLLTAYAPRPQELLDGSVGTTQIADDAVTTPKLIANAVVAGKIAAGAITTAKLDAAAVTADKIAAGAVTADKLLVGLMGNALTNPGFETGDLTGWSAELLSGGSITVDQSNPFAGSYRARLANGATASAATLVGSGFVPASPHVTVVMSARGNFAPSTSAFLFIRCYDASLTLLGSVTAPSVTGAGTWASITASLTPLANTAYITFALRLVTASAAAGFDDLALNVGGAIIDSTGIKVVNGAIVVENPAGTVVIDGTSNMFKIAATGTQSVPVAVDSTASNGTTVAALGALPTTPAHLSFIANGNSTAAAQHLGVFFTNVAAKWVAPTNGGPTNQDVVIPDQLAEAHTLLVAGSQVQAVIAGWNRSGASVTYYHRFYILKEAAL